MSNLLATAWLLGLLAAAPLLRTQSRYAFVDRLRDALILGVAIPFVLAFVHALYAAALWATLFVCIALALRRRFPRDKAAGAVPYLTIAALVAVTWPQIVRPLLEGDSLWYHLPNAASWVQSHSLWSSATHYWWYPPASELFASGLYAVSTPFALPWCGTGALALLGFRIAVWAREAFDAPPLLADAIAAATVTAYPLAIQGGTLQNDVWLAAFWLEALWLLRMRERGAAAPTIALTVLLKPQGWLFAAVALAVRKAPLRLWLVGIATLAVWLLHDALLWHGAGVRSAGTMADVVASTILAHGVAALLLLARVTVALSPLALLALCAALLGPAIARTDRGLGWAGFWAAMLFFVLPYGYASSVAQLATGASLRFAAPAIAAGVLVLAVALRRVPVPATVLAVASALFGVAVIVNVFWNDGATRGAPAVALVVVALAIVARRASMPWLNPLVFAALVIFSMRLAQRQPVDYYADALRVGGKASGVYDWIAATRPAAVGGWGLRLGTVNVLSPATRTIDLPDAAPCADARINGTLLVAVAENDRDAALNARRLAEARRCGTVLYDDRLAVVTKPY